MNAAGIAKRRNASARPWASPASESRAASTSMAGSRRRSIFSKVRPQLGRSFTLSAPPANERRSMVATSLTWLGHASFRLDSPCGKRVYVDPWLDNPKCPESERDPERCDVIAVTHGHSDHLGSVVAITQKVGAVPIVAQVELKGWLRARGAQTDDVPGPNKGGTVEAEGIKFTLTNAFHSSSADDGTYLGEAAGIVIELEDGKKIYFAGDTCVFGDMQLIGRIYSPDLAVLPIGG